jgi:hypothetical protein
MAGKNEEIERIIDLFLAGAGMTKRGGEEFFGCYRKLI